MPSRSRRNSVGQFQSLLSQPGVFTAFTLPRTNANLGTNQLELIEDFTGVVGISGSTVTISSPTRGTLTATSTSNSFFDPSPTALFVRRQPRQLRREWSNRQC